jgi:hypothetical protein
MIKKIAIVAAVVLAAIAFLAAVVSGFAAPHWVLPAAVLALAVAVVL